MSRKKSKTSLSCSNIQPQTTIKTNKTRNEDSPFDSNDLLNKKWKVFRASPLFNFKENSLKTIEKKLNFEINSRTKFGSEVLYSSSFKLVKEFQLKEESVEAVQVEVTSNVKKVFYLGYFLSFLKGKEKSEIGFNLVFLVDSRSSDVQNIHSSLCKILDCDIQPVTFLLVNLITFFVKLLENPQENTTESQEVITLGYKIPGCHLNDNLEVTLVLEDTTIVLAFTIDGLRESFPKVTNMEIMSEFYSRLLNHIYKIYKVDLMMTKLNKIVFPHTFLTAEGQFKTSSANSLNLILNVLQHICPLKYLSNYKSDNDFK